MSLGQAILFRIVLLWLSLGAGVFAFAFVLAKRVAPESVGRVPLKAFFVALAKATVLGPVSVARYAHAFWLGHSIARQGGSLKDVENALDPRPEGCLPKGRGCSDWNCDACYQDVEPDEPKP